MVPKLIECVPNFSEGSDARTIDQIVTAINSVSGAHVLDVHMDADHNRSVVTFAGPPVSVEQAALRAVGQASRLIDLTRHQGVHPRIGATDVLPFVPLTGVTLAECADLAHRVGREIWAQYRIPVYFYGSAAIRPERQHLENIRRGGFEGLRKAVGADPTRKPDVGGPYLHPTSGATAVGARDILIAFNVNLDSGDADIARAIARAVRESSGGLPAVKAMGVGLRSRESDGRRGLVQVSMNLTDWRRTSIKQAYRAIEREAARHNVPIHSSELVGLTPEGALEGCSPQDLKLVGIGPENILECCLKERWGPDWTS